MTLRLIATLASALALFLFSPVAVAEHSNAPAQNYDKAIGPVINAAAPKISPLTLQNSPFDLEATLGSAGTIVVFVRSADWCPFCKRQLIDLNRAQSALADTGWSLVTLSYDTHQKLAAFAGQSEITYPLLSDTDSVTIRAFSLLNEDVDKNSRSYGIPHPAIVFIAKDGTVKAMLREEGYRERPSVEALMEEIVCLKDKFGPGACQRRD